MRGFIVHKRVAAGLGLMTSLIGGCAGAQEFPGQPMRFVTGLPAGSGADSFTRFVAEKMKEVSGASIVVENRVGATGAIAMEFVARAKPDGYTAYLTAGSATASANHIFKIPRVNVLEAFRIAGTINRMGFMIAVDGKSPHKTLQELTAALKAKGDKGNYGVSATSGIVLAETYKAIAGLETGQVRFRGGGDTLNELAAGNLDFSSIDPGFSIPQHNAGRLRILAVSTGKRVESIPDIPTLNESGVKGVDQTVWWCIALPKATPDAIVNKINAWLNEALRKPESKKFFNDAGGDIFISTPAEADALFAREVEAWGEYLRVAKIEKQ